MGTGVTETHVAMHGRREQQAPLKASILQGSIADNNAWTLAAQFKLTYMSKGL